MPAIARLSLLLLLLLLLSSAAAFSQTFKISHSPNPSTLVFSAFANRGSINGSFQDGFCHF